MKGIIGRLFKLGRGNTGQLHLCRKLINVLRFHPAKWQLKTAQVQVLTWLTLIPVYGTMGLPFYGLLVFLWAGKGFAIVRGSGIFLLLGAALGVSAFLSEGFFSGLSRLVELESHLLLAWLVGSSFSSEMRERTIRLFLGASLVWNCIGLWQQWAAIPTPPGWLSPEQTAVIRVRSGSVFGNPNIYALYLVSVICLASYRTASVRGRYGKIYYLVVLWLAIVSLYFTYSRSGWLLGVFFLVYWIGKRCRQGLFLLYLAGGGLWLCGLSGFQVRIWSLLHFSDNSLQYRIRIWNGVARALDEYGLWGAGPGGFKRIYPAFQSGLTPCLHAHSFYFQWWLEYGVFGLIAFLAFLRKLFQDRGKISSPEQTPLRMTLLLFLIGGIWESWQESLFCSGYFWIIAGMLLSFQNGESKKWLM